MCITKIKLVEDISNASDMEMGTADENSFVDEKVNVERFNRVWHLVYFGGNSYGSWSTSRNSGFTGNGSDWSSFTGGGHSSGRKGSIRLRGKGVSGMKNPNAKGDQYVTVEIQVPRQLTPKAKEALEEYRRVS